MATAIAVNHKNSEEFSPEPEHPPIVSSATNSTNSLSRYPVISFIPCDSLSQPDILDADDTMVAVCGGDLSQPTHLELSEEVFPDLKTAREEEESKLVEWVKDVYMPACKQLLECLRVNPIDKKSLYSYVKVLSNVITFFCIEHQQIQSQKEMVSPSKSFTGLDNYNRSNKVPVMFGHTLSPPPVSVSSRRDSQSQTAMAVKVLRSVSSSLLPPLLDKISNDYSTNLLQDTVVAIQKISWKVEACLSMCTTIETCVVHDELFCDSVLTEEIRESMIASPPEELKIQNSPAHIVSLGLREDLISLDSDMEAYWEKQRRRENSIGDMVSAMESSGKEGYFRPGRRTTVSISKRQVLSLGLNVVDATAPDSLSPKRSNTVATKNPLELVEGSENYLSIRERVLKKLAKEFPQLQVDEEDVETLQKRPSTLPINASKISPVVETRSSSAPLLPINQGPVNRSRFRERHSHEPLLMEENLSETVNSKGNGIGERTRSLEFDKLRDVSPVVSPSPTRTELTHETSPRNSTMKSSNNSSTMPTKRRQTFVKMVKKKARSFGRADSRIKQRTPVLRNKSTSEFFSPDEDRTGSESPIEQFVLTHPREASCTSSDYLHFLNVEVADAKLVSPRRRRFSVSSNSKSLHLRHPTTVELNINTDIPDLESESYSIQRSLKDILALYDLLLSTTVTAGCLPERPDRRSKEWRSQVEELMQFVSSSPELRTVPEFVAFMKPGEMSVESCTALYKESEFELLTTFFTPLTYGGGLPGTHHEVDIVGKDLPTPSTSYPSRSRRSYPSISNGRGSIHIKKSDGEEEATFIIREEGKDVLIISEELDRFVVVAGTFEKLVEQLACEEKPDPKYVTTLLLGHRHFASSADLMSFLIKKFNKIEAPDAPEEELAYAEKWKYFIQLRVLDIITFWMKSFWSDFERSHQALVLLQELLESLQVSSDPNFPSIASSMCSVLNSKLNNAPNKISAKRHSNSSSSPSFSPTRSSSLSPSHKPLASGTISLPLHPDNIISSFTGIQLARQLTLIELDYLRAIDVYELAFYTWGSSDEGRKYRQNLDAYIARFNKTSYWVASEVLRLEDERQRGIVIEKFIEVAKHSQELKNFNTTVSIITGISLTCVRRLEKSWKHVSERGLRSFNKLKGLITPSNNHSEYRKALGAVLQSQREACIPYFGVFMRDITLCNEGTPKKLKNGLYNFSKLRTLVMMVGT